MKIDNEGGRLNRTCERTSHFGWNAMSVTPIGNTANPMWGKVVIATRFWWYDGRCVGEIIHCHFYKYQKENE